ncbi:MAG: dTMP kinase [Ruminococcaceae bacterium]|jgi:dTMP kinase|nr:dTMP kinase [Oscillospiraceae bacterium]
MLYNKDKLTDRQQNLPSNTGRLITFEGIDGSGKTTQIELLSARLAAEGIPVLLLREPGGTQIGEAIRGILLDKAHTSMCIETELLLFAAARAQLVREVIVPELDAGKWVICDRFYDSTIAYQGYGRQIDPTVIRSLNQLAVARCRPDITFLLDLPVDCALTRLAGRNRLKDRLDNESVSFMQRTREGYCQLAKDEPDRIVIMNATEPEEQLAEHIYHTIREGLAT